VALPVKTTADDVRAVAKYLKTKPAGATAAEVKAVSKALSDGRKLSAFVTWGVISRNDGTMTLTERGATLARHPDKEQEVFRAIIDTVRPYRSAVEWAHHKGMASIDRSMWALIGMQIIRTLWVMPTSTLSARTLCAS
jgi:hypothetical protein